MDKPIIKSIRDAGICKLQITSTDVASIYYTIDGTEPNINSTLYTEPINYPDKGTVLKAIALRDSEQSEITEYICIHYLRGGGYMPNSYRQFGTILITEPIDVCGEELTTVNMSISGFGKICNASRIWSSAAYIMPMGIDYDIYFINCGEFDRHIWKAGQIFTKNNKLIRYDGTSWHTLQEIYSDKFNNKPTVEQGIPIGFAYFCTDKQSPESTQPGLMIYHKGNNVWIDSMNRIVDDNYPQQTKIFVSKEEVSNAINNDLFRSSHNIVTSLSNVPTDKFLVIAEIQSAVNQSFSLSGNTLEAGKEIHVIIHNNSGSKITVTIPDNLPYINCNGESILSILKNSYAEINIISIGDKLYVRTI